MATMNPRWMYQASEVKRLRREGRRFRLIGVAYICVKIRLGSGLWAPAIVSTVKRLLRTAHSEQRTNVMRNTNDMMCSRIRGSLNGKMMNRHLRHCHIQRNFMLKQSETRQRAGRSCWREAGRDEVTSMSWRSAGPDPCRADEEEQVSTCIKLQFQDRNSASPFNQLLTHGLPPLTSRALP